LLEKRAFYDGGEKSGKSSFFCFLFIENFSMNVKSFLPEPDRSPDKLSKQRKASTVFNKK